MSNIQEFNSINRLAKEIRNFASNKSFILIYAYNGTGKTRLSMEFKNIGKSKNNGSSDTLYFNAYTEDLFSWDNDLDNDSERVLKINHKSKFFIGLPELALEDKIRKYLYKYADFDFDIDYTKWSISFSRENNENIKISRGEETMFIWSFFLAIAELAIDEADSYKWVKYIYIDDPISSLDDNNAIAIAVDLVRLLSSSNERIHAVISSHHSLFFNVVCNELHKKNSRFFLHKSKDGKYKLQPTDDTPFFHHVAILNELNQALQTGKLYTHHFNALRAIMEKTSTFFGQGDFSFCLQDINNQDEILYARVLNLMSHGQYSIYEPIEMIDDNKQLFKRIFDNFIRKYNFALPEIFQHAKPVTQAINVTSAT